MWWQNNPQVQLLVIDTGAFIYIIDKFASNTLQKQRPITLKHSKTCVFAYGATHQLPFMEQYHATLECSTGTTTTQIHVIKGNFGYSLSYQTASALGSSTLKVNKIKPCHSILEQLLKTAWAWWRKPQSIISWQFVVFSFCSTPSISALKFTVKKLLAKCKHHVYIIRCGMTWQKKIELIQQFPPFLYLHGRRYIATACVVLS